MLSREVLFNSYRLALRHTLLTSSSSVRSFHTGSALYRQSNTKKKPIASGVSKPSSSKRIHASLDENKRAKWMEATEKEKSLRNHFPIDNVFFAPHYSPELFSVSKAVDIFREIAAPEMLDHADGELHVNIQVSMRTNKKAKHVFGVSSTVKVPHRPTFLPPRKIIVFTANQEEAKAAKEAGALDAGAETLVAQIEHGFYHWEAYDNVVCHTDFLPKMAPIRKLLRGRYPAGDRLGANILEMLDLHSQGILVQSEKEAAIPEVARISLPLGRLSDPIEHMSANLQTYVNTVHSLRSGRITGKFIEKMELYAPPCPLSLRLELYPELEPEKFQKRGKKAAKAEAAVESADGGGAQEEAEVARE